MILIRLMLIVFDAEYWFMDVMFRLYMRMLRMTERRIRHMQALMKRILEMKGESGR